MQIECLLPKAKVTFSKFGERYCLSASYYPKAYYGSKYDGGSSSAVYYLPMGVQAVGISSMH